MLAATITTASIARLTTAAVVAAVIPAVVEYLPLLLQGRVPRIASPR
jgi:hypothetical protein